MNHILHVWSNLLQFYCTLKNGHEIYLKPWMKLKQVETHKLPICSKYVAFWNRWDLLSKRGTVSYNMQRGVIFTLQDFKGLTNRNTYDSYNVFPSSVNKSFSSHLGTAGHHLQFLVNYELFTYHGMPRNCQVIFIYSISLETNCSYILMPLLQDDSSNCELYLFKPVNNLPASDKETFHVSLKANLNFNLI